MTKFQLILTGIFGFFIVAGVVIFSAYRGSSGDVPTVVIWGTISENSFSNIIKNTSLFQNDNYKIQYVSKKEENFDQSFVEALASGQGPDLFMLPSEKILTHRNKILPIPYSVFTERQFKDSFIEGTEIYMAPEGILGLPIYADPLVMYWNRSIFTDALLTSPPKYWDEFYNLASLISKKDGALNIQRSAVAMGEYSNISHAKEIIINLAMQAGTPVTSWRNGSVVSTFNFSYNKPITPAIAAINFYTEFGNPSKNSYSWNRSLPNSTNYFLGGDLALYFGFASEISDLQVRNPNLNFDVATVPLSREGGENVSYSRFNSLAITKASKNSTAAFAIASILSGAESGKAFVKELRLPPVRRDLLAEKQTIAYQSIFYQSTIRSKSWLDPAPLSSDGVFRDMIQSITSGRSRSSEALSRADQELSNLLTPQ